MWKRPKNCTLRCGRLSYRHYAAIEKSISPNGGYAMGRQYNPNRVYEKKIAPHFFSNRLSIVNSRGFTP
jgi:hypothetical protein